LIKAKFPGKEINISSFTKDETKALIDVYGDRDPGEKYFFDRSTKKLIYQYTPRPKLKEYEKYFSKMEPIKYKSSDALEIPAYLTLPQGSSNKNLPLLVLPHGGPWDRDSWRFSTWVQWLANRGFAVLQPNFRASTGYGKKFLDAGNLQWGKLMQDDITWGIKYLIDQGTVDAKRVAIFGGSYGGYATLAGLTYTPDFAGYNTALLGRFQNAVYLAHGQ
jgi:dipeptidyl aminopeptidase/acylaminoacyl peptidase